MQPSLTYIHTVIKLKLTLNGLVMFIMHGVADIATLDMHLTYMGTPPTFICYIFPRQTPLRPLRDITFGRDARLGLFHQLF